MASEKVKLADLIRDSMNYDLEKTKFEQDDINKIEEMIRQNTQLIRKINVIQDINDLSYLKGTQEELVSQGLVLDIFINENNHFYFTLNGEENDIRCESLATLEKCIKAFMIGYKQRA